MRRASILSPTPPAVAGATVAEAAPILGAGTLSDTAVEQIANTNNMDGAATVFPMPAAFPLPAAPPARVSPWLSFISDSDPGVRSWRDIFARVGRASPACAALEAAFNAESNSQLRALRVTLTATVFVYFVVQVFTVNMPATWATRVSGSIVIGICFMLQFARPARGSALFSLTVLCLSGAHVRVRGFGCRMSRPSDAVAREPQRCPTGASTSG